MTGAVFLSVVAIHLVAAMSPGPSFVVAVRTAASDGFGVACALAVGFGLGAVLWAMAAMAGLALVFEVMPQLFVALKLLGGAFLIYIAVMMWRHASAPLSISDQSVPRSWQQAVRFGFLTFASNPKTAVFFGAVFVGLVPADVSWGWRAALLAAIFVNETGWYIIVARVFSLPRARAGYVQFKSHVDRMFGSLIAAFGVKIALT